MTISLPAPAYKVELVEKNNAHYYRVDGKDTLLPGYSTIFRKVVAKPALVQWAAKLSAKAAADAAHAEASKAVADGKWGRSLAQARDAWEEEGAAAPNAKRDKAADTGTGLHSDLEYIVKGMNLPERQRTNEDVRAVQNFLSFWGESGLRYVASEVCVAVPPEEIISACEVFPGLNDGKNRIGHEWPCAPYGGKLDLIVADKQDRLILADFKTGSAVDRKKGKPYPDVFVQLGAYRTAMECTYPGVKIHGMAMLHVRHDVPPEKILYTCPDMETASRAWIGVRGLYDDLRSLEG